MTGKSMLTARYRSSNARRSGEFTSAITISNLAFPLDSVDIAPDANPTTVTESKKPKKKS